ncbi:MAG: GNAT family N-acetyltransferase [Candidatus Bipolaricaulota bacterium]
MLQVNEPARSFTVRPIAAGDREAVRRLAAEDLYERPGLLKRFPRWGEYRADGLAHFYDAEPESCFVAVSQGEVVGNLLGTTDAARSEQRRLSYTRPLQRRRLLHGAYGVPVFLVPIVRTERRPPLDPPPPVDRELYPAEFHLGVAETWQRRGVGRALVARFEGYLRDRGVPGYRIYAASYHPKGVAFYRRLGLDELGTFRWKLHDGSAWREVTEHVFVRRLKRGSP